MTTFIKPAAGSRADMPETQSDFAFGPGADMAGPPAAWGTRITKHLVKPYIDTLIRLTDHPPGDE